MTPSASARLVRYGCGHAENSGRASAMNGQSTICEAPVSEMRPSISTTSRGPAGIAYRISSTTARQTAASATSITPTGSHAIRRMRALPPPSRARASVTPVKYILPVTSRTHALTEMRRRDRPKVDGDASPITTAPNSIPICERSMRWISS